MTTYSLSQVSEIVYTSKERINRWIAEKYFYPALEQEKGKPKRFTFDDLLYLAVLKKLLEVGLDLGSAWDVASTACKHKSDRKPRILSETENVIGIEIDMETIENRLVELLQNKRRSLWHD